MDGSSSVRLCSSPDEVFLLLGCESQGKRGCWAVNAKSGSRSRCCLLPWKQANKHLSAYWVLIFIVNADTLCGWLLRVQPTSQTPGPGPCPSPFISGAVAFRVLTACLVSFICSCSSFPVLSLSLSLSITKVWPALREEDCIILSTRLPRALGAL